MTTRIFKSLEEAAVWLYTKGWRQNDDGVWIKEPWQANIRRSPANDGMVSVVFVRL